MEQKTIADGEGQYVPQTVTQYVYLDFDGADTQYANDELGLSWDVTVEDSGIAQEHIDEITAQLNRQYAADNIIFVSSVPTNSVYSTIYVGKTDAFDSYGEFYGLSTTIDAGNQINDDDAFVLLDSTSSNAEIIQVIAHETDHITAGKTHGQNTQSGTLSVYAMDRLLSTDSSSFTIMVDGRTPDTMAETKYWSPDYPYNATKVVVTVTNKGKTSGANWTSCDEDIYLYGITGSRWTVQSGKSVSFTLTPDDYNDITITRSNYLITEAPWPSYKHLYGYVENTVTITAKYYQEIAIPDLTITSSQLSRTALDTVRFDPSESFVYTFTVKNAGDLNAASSKAYIYVDGVKYEEISVAALAEGAAREYSFTFAPGSLSQGEHTVYVTADGAGVINEFSERNNAADEQEFIIEPAMADLTVKEFKISDANQAEILASDRTVVISATIENRSANKDSVATTAVLYAGNKVIATFSVPAVKTAGTTVLTHTIPAGELESGETEFKLVIDPDGKCTEFNEKNNSSAVTRTINSPIKPDLRIKQFSCANKDNKTTVNADQDLQISIELENYIDGNLLLGRASKAVNLQLWCDGIKLKNFQAPALTAGETHTLECTIPENLLSPGRHNFKVVIDPESQCEENNEENNTYEKTFNLSRHLGIDLQVRDLKAAENPIDNDGEIEFTVTNKGNLTSKQTLAVLDLAPYHGDDESLPRWEEVTIDPLAPGETRTYKIKTTQYDIAMGTLTVTIDPHNINYDKDISNNSCVSEKIYRDINIPYPNVGAQLALTTTDRWQSFEPGKNFTISAGNVMYVAYRIGNDFPDDSIYLFCDDILIKSWDEVYTNVNNEGIKWYFLPFSTDLLPAGQHKLRIFYDVWDNCKTESEVLNSYYLYERQWHEVDAVIKGSSEKSDWSHPQFDLTLTSAEVTEHKNLSDVWQLTFSVKNASDILAHYNSIPHAVCLYEGENKISEYFLPMIKAGEEKNFSFALPVNALSAGEHNLKLQIECKEDPLDKNLGNNSIELSVNIPAVSRVSITASQKNNDDNTVSVSAAATNNTGLMYSIDLEDWESYTGPVVVYKNCIVYFRCKDKNGSITVKAHEVTDIITAENLHGDVSGVFWENINEEYIAVEYSQNSFDNTLKITAPGNAVDTYNLPAGTFQWRVKSVEGENIVSDDTEAQQKFVSDADGDMDLFFANADGTWEAGYAAEHQGFREGWTGTKEQVILNGKNRIADVFSGSDDANVLVLTDGSNGDALFVEDIFTAFGKDAARISQIDEIRAGAGDDVIDMTSQKFAYAGDEMTIRGGLGNDVVWATGGDNDLFGDAGNDRIAGSKGFDLIVGGAGNDSLHTGGGGNDIFAFCENWGVDTVQLTDSDNSITLWFASGSKNNWDAAERVYRYGNNSVTVIGGENCNIDLKFGDEGGQYGDLVSVGAFEGATSEKIFEEKNSGMLA